MSNKLDKIIKLEKIFTKVLKLKSKKNIQSLSMQNSKQWDSLNHLRLILEIEKNFNFSFDMKKIPNLKSFKIIALEITKKT